MLETMNEYKTINEKMGDTVCLAVEKLGVSEYNTRSTCVDKKHVDALTKKIMERGFHPKRAISVNVIRGAGGSEVSYRVAAGIHRLEATKKAGLGEIPSLLYYDLTEEEECLLDRWDNEMDEDHKPIHFLEEAEHYKYLQDVKKWSQRQIARNKGVNLRDVNYRVQIGKLPEEVKKIVRGVSPGKHFFEKYFRDICKLSEPHIITICEEIAERGELADQGEKDRWGRPVQPMKQAEIKKRVDELLKTEKAGKIERRVKESLPVQMDLFAEEKDEPEAEPFAVKTVVEELEQEDKHVEQPPQKEPIPELSPEMAYESPEKNSRKMNLDRCVRWLKNAGLFEMLGQTAYIALRKIEEYDLWYRGNSAEPFFLAGDPFALIAKQSGVEKEHIQKRVMPLLKREGYFDYWQDTKGRNSIWWFSLSWDKLFRVYCKKAYSIPFDEDGLKNIPPTFTGVLRPTPFHFIRIVKGQVMPWGKEETEKGFLQNIPERTYEDILGDELRRLTPPMGEKEIAECLEKRSETELALKLFQEMDSRKRSEIKNESSYLLGMIRKGVGAPKGFVTPQQAREYEEEQKRLQDFFREFREKRPRYFLAGNSKKYEISVVDGDNGFFYRKDDGSEPFASFEKWGNMKFFQ